jgi:Uma2 family endonuclease
MNVALRLPSTLDEFLAWEERQELRYEFDGVRAVAMVGGTWAHGQICLNIALALRSRMRAGCSVSVHDAKLRLAASIRYPDVMVVCSPVRNTATFVTDPVVVFEVLSERTSRTDRLVKSQEYGAAPSIARYVIVEQDSIGATVFARPDWRGQPLTGADTVLALPEIGVELRLGDCYAGLEFDAEQEP